MTKILSIWFLIVFISSAGLLVGKWGIDSVDANNDSYKELKIFTEVLSLVERNYVEKVDVKDLVYGAIRGMLSSLDPHSSFMTADAYKEMQVDTRGVFGGLGIQIGIKDSVLTVITPIEDTPAFKAGIKAGDKIIKVDGAFTKDMTLMEAVHKMRGRKGTPVTITIIRKGLKEPRNYKIVRDIIKIKSVKYKVLGDGIGYVKISQFQEKTADELAVALKKLDSKKIKSLILDLRNNPGGLLNSAVEVSGEFLPQNKLVVYIKGRVGKKQEYYTKGKRAHYNYPMIILVNQGSASASEIVSGAMKDWDRAVILGMPTFGKGSVQSVIPLSDGSALRLTTAKYYTPKGTSIQNTGIKPDIEVRLPVKNGQGHVILRESDLKGHLRNEQLKKPAAGKKHEKILLSVGKGEDLQLKRATELLKMWDTFKSLPGEKAARISAD
ncbi:MAG TPA: S41 family peptidase [Nitrospirae bacterium]|nr:S41 family peptidase [Nitrospirota bacterium]HDO23438.1 S41 family peptidase [Nitrospirota bacterium]HDZ88439.1 S41 family peptidase [Nitrospirota bacterium]